ncbi:MAG TPA: hypothetical protein PL131_11270 [Methylotenera sp.]|mgnify:CR=1 FL=1|nr:hypothetical protein [Methylotenera sp.]HPH06447.1 hypothetical protein [Methylotenera sp.]HPN00406.1 hypothetical protein [Methylotenera sp.]
MIFRNAFKQFVTLVVVMFSSIGYAAPTIKDAENFILYKFSSIVEMDSDEFSTWSIHDPKIGKSTEWTWRENSVVGKGHLAISKFETYLLDPRELAYPVTYKGNKIFFECAKVRCMSVKIRTMDSVNNRFLDTDETRTSNWWYFKTEEDAQRVAKAMNFLLKTYGAKVKQDQF